MLTTIIKAFDTIVIIAKTSCSITLSLTGIGLMVIPISCSLACGLTFSNEIINEIVMKKCKRFKKQYETDEQTNISFDKLYRRSLQDKIIDESE